MSSGGPSRNGDGSSAAAAAAAPSLSSRPGSFVTQQFSAATEMILKRLRGGGGPLDPRSVTAGAESGLQPPGYEEVRRSVLEGMKTTLNMDLGPPASGPGKKGTKAAGARNSPATATTTFSTAANGGNSGAKSKSASKTSKPKAGTKRKRIKEESESAEESAEMSGLGGDSDTDLSVRMTPQPTQTLSGRKVIKPAQFSPAAATSDGPSRKRGSHFKRTGRSVENALCKTCGRGRSIDSNMIVFCDRCNLGWHQKCQDPPVSDDVVKDESKSWFCKDCTAKRPQPRTASPAMEPWKSLGFSGKTQEEKHAYLTSFPHAHLVTLLLKATNMHSDVLIYPPAGRTTNESRHEQQQNLLRTPERRPYATQQFTPSTTAASGSLKRADANHMASINFIRKMPEEVSVSSSIFFNSSTSPTSATGSLTAPQFPHISSTPIASTQSQVLSGLQPTEEDGESRESTPASPPYPRPGNGLMATLLPDNEDSEWLVGEGQDEVAFEHIIIDEYGRAEKVKEAAT